MQAALNHNEQEFILIVRAASKLRFPDYQFGIEWRSSCRMQFEKLLLLAKSIQSEIINLANVIAKEADPNIHHFTKQNLQELSKSYYTYRRAVMEVEFLIEDVLANFNEPERGRVLLISNQVANNIIASFTEYDSLAHQIRAFPLNGSKPRERCECPCRII